MKKIALSFLIFIAVQANCQKKFGVIVGASNSFFTQGIVEDANVEYTVTPQAGVFYEMKLTNNIHFMPRLGFTQQRGTMVDNQVYGYHIIDYSLNYLSVPMDFKFWNKIYLIAGPQFGVLITKNVPAYYEESIQSSTDFGANIGLGVRIHNTFIEAGAYQGFVNTVNGSGRSSYRHYNNAAFRISFGWRIF